MWSRTVAAVGLLVTLAALASAQNPNVYSRAVPPAQTVLAPLNLRTEWTLYLPIEGRRDSIEMVQTVDDQIFVQTRTGLLVTVDARTGRILWSAALGNGGYSNVYPVAVNSRFVFATNVTKMHAFYRYTGVTEFSVDMGTTPTTGLAADESGVYAVLATRPGSAGSHRVAAYGLPNPIVVPEPAAKAEPGAPGAATKARNPVDELTGRYPLQGAPRSSYESEALDRTRRAPAGEGEPLGGMSGSRTPSLTVVPRVSPPYTVEGGPFSPSLTTLPSLRRPYHLRDETARYIQRTPSINSIPPSVAASLALADLSPRGVEPPLRWEYGLTSRGLYTPLLSPLRVWTATDGPAFMALSKVDRTVEVTGPLWAQISAPPGHAGTTAYVPLATGAVVAVNLETGNRVGGLDIAWRVNVGGLANRQPVVTEDAVYAAGDNSGVVRVNRATGAIVWRTDRTADRVAAVNQDFVYIRDRQGRLLVYDARRATDPGTGRSAPLTGVSLPEFNVPVVNTASDRLYLAADNGLLVCLRDAAAKYAAPVRIAPPLLVNPAPKKAVEGLPDGMMPPPTPPN